MERAPEGLGLDQFRKFDPSTSPAQMTTADDVALPENSIFFRLGQKGLISFSDYIFLLTVLSTSRCFHMPLSSVKDSY